MRLILFYIGDVARSGALDQSESNNLLASLDFHLSEGLHDTLQFVLLELGNLSRRYEEL